MKLPYISRPATRTRSGTNSRGLRRCGRDEGRDEELFKFCPPPPLDRLNFPLPSFKFQPFNPMTRFRPDVAFLPFTDLYLHRAPLRDPWIDRTAKFRDRRAWKRIGYVERIAGIDSFSRRRGGGGKGGGGSRKMDFNGAIISTGGYRRPIGPAASKDNSRQTNFTSAHV